MKQLFQNFNRSLELRLIPSKDLPIYCNSVSDPNDIAFNKTLKENGLIFVILDKKYQ